MAEGHHGWEGEVAEAAGPRAWYADAPPGRSSRIFDAGVAAAGAALTVLALGRLPLAGGPLRETLLAVAVAAPLVLLTQHFYVSLTLSSPSPNAPVMTFESAGLIFLACTFPPWVVLLAWGLVQVPANLIDPVTWPVRCFNYGLLVCCAGAALAVAAALGGLQAPLTDPGTLLVVLVAGGTYLAGMYLVVAASVALEQRQSLLAAVSARRVVTALPAHLAAGSLAVLGALLVDHLPVWTALLLALPVIAVLVSANALSRAEEHQHRLHSLLDAAGRMHSADSQDGILRVLAEHAASVVGIGGAQVRAEPPAGSQFGARVVTAAGEVWVVADGVNRGRDRQEADRKALEALATVAQEALLRASLAEEMSRLAMHDALTGLANRKLFLRRAEEVLVPGQGVRAAILFMDLDGFKAVNDRFGHPVGDELLVVIGQRLAGCIREGDVLARLGGDEFAVLVDASGPDPDPAAVARRIIDAVGDPVVLRGELVVVGVSIGIALATPADLGGAEPAKTAHLLLGRADLAMYQAKRRGRNGFHVHEPGAAATATGTRPGAVPAEP